MKCEGYSIKKEFWHEILEEYPEIAEHLKK